MNFGCPCLSFLLSEFDNGDEVADLLDFMAGTETHHSDPVFLGGPSIKILLKCRRLGIESCMPI